MKYYIVLSPDAKANIGSAVWWYQYEDPNVAFRFTLKVFDVLRRIARYPYGFPLINGRFRRAVLKRFPYSIYYSLDIDRISVIAVLHQRQDYDARIYRGNGRVE